MHCTKYIYKYVLMQRALSKAQNGSKIEPLQTWVSSSNINKQHKKVYWCGSGGKRSSDGLVLSAHVRYLCQNRPETEAERPPRPTGRLFHPKFCQQPSCIITIWFTSRNEHDWTLGQISPSGIYARTIINI